MIELGYIYLNKNTRFACKNGNAVWFKALNGDFKTFVNGAEVLTDNCVLGLIGPPHPGQCNLMPDPLTGAPSPCIAALIQGIGWNKPSGLTVSGRKALGSSCWISCPRQGVVRPFKPTYMSINVNDDVSNCNICMSSGTGDMVGQQGEISSNGPDKRRESGISSDAGSDTDSQHREKEADESEENSRTAEYALCNYKACKDADNCPYLKASHVPKETDESKNAKTLKENMGRERFDMYAEECSLIAASLYGKDTYSIAHHHIVPVNQCFKQFPELVKLANYYEYDINNSLNGICLPTKNQGFDGQPQELRLKIAFLAMEKLGKQWHKGHHKYKLEREIADLFIGSKPIKDYKAAVDEYLRQFRDKLWQEHRCRVKNYQEEAVEFKMSMNHICRKIEDKLRKFETQPKKSHSFFVSKEALYYAYYDMLKDYQNILFSKAEGQKPE